MPSTAPIRNLIAGLGTVLQLFPPRRTRRLGGRLILEDQSALRSDWRAVGTDLRAAISTVGEEQQSHARAAAGR